MNQLVVNTQTQKTELIENTVIFFCFVLCTKTQEIDLIYSSHSIQKQTPTTAEHLFQVHFQISVDKNQAPQKNPPDCHKSEHR